MASESAQATSLRPGPAPRGTRSDTDDNAEPLRCLDTGEMPIVDVQKDHSGKYGEPVGAATT
jgi:hypothetical protein